MWKDFFSFSKSEQRSVGILLSVIAIILCGRWYLANYPQPKPIDFSNFQQEVVAFEVSLETIETKKSYENSYPEKSIYDSLVLFPFDPNTCQAHDFKRLGLSDRQISILENYRSKGGRFFNTDDFRKIYGIPEWQSDVLEDYISIAKSGKDIRDKNDKEVLETELFYFDPNTATQEELCRLGIPERIAANLLKYRNSGGVFETKPDLLRIYGFDSLKYSELEPYIQLPAKSQVAESGSDTLAVAKGVLLVGLNSADTARLKILPGIGDVFAGRIVKYRELLGGYVDKKQLLEVFGMQQTRYEKIQDLVFVDRANRKMAINFADQKQLQAHPYLSYEQARSIVRFRNKNGSFTSLDQLLGEGILDENTFEKIVPYLRLKN